MALILTIKGVEISIGSVVRVAQTIKEGEKERIQNYEGVVIAFKGEHGERTFTVRRIGVDGIGIEKVFPVDLPSIAGVTLVRKSNVHRSKLYYFRKRTGKAALQLEEVRVSDKQNVTSKKTVVAPKKARVGARKAGGVRRAKVSPKK